MPSITRRLRGLFLLLGIGLLIWLPVEDTHLGWVIFFAAASAVLTGLQIAVGVQRRLASDRIPLIARWGLVGLMIGALIVPYALFLMAFKSGIHGHSRPDYSPDQIVTVMRRTPIFVLSGTFCGLGAGIYQHFNRDPDAD